MSTVPVEKPPLPPTAAPAIPYISHDMLPAIYANVISKKVSLAILSLIVWGIWNARMLALQILVYPEGNWSDFSSFSFLDVMRELGGPGFGLFMIGMGIYGIVTRHPRVILFDGALVGLVGLWNLIFCIIGLFWAREDVFWLYNRYMLPLIALLQITWSWQEFQNYKVVERWAEQAGKVSAAEKARVKQLLRVFFRLDESYADGRIKLNVVRKGAYLYEKRVHFCGQLVGDEAILVARNFTQCLLVHRATAGAAKYKEAHSKLLTDFGFRTLYFGPGSVMIWKLWAGVKVLPADVQRGAKKRVGSLSMFKAILARESQGGDAVKLRLAILDALVKLPYSAEVGRIAASLLDDQAEKVRIAALGFCRQFRVDGLHERVIPMLKDDKLRGPAAAYIATCPSPEAIAPLKKQLVIEGRRKIQRQMKKAIRSCGGDENIFAMDVLG